MNFDLQTAQADMRRAYFRGATGVAASSLAWLGAACVALRGRPDTAMWTLLVAGVFIHPVAMLLSKLAGRSGAHSKGNPLGLLAGGSTFWMIFCLPLACAASRVHVEWFFPAMLLVIGGRYLTFDTLYGERLYWPCGLALAAAGFALGRVLAAPSIATFAGGAIEAGFTFAVASREWRAMRPAYAG